MEIKNNLPNFIFITFQVNVISNHGVTCLISWLRLCVYMFYSPEPIYDLMFLLLKTQILYFTQSAAFISNVNVLDQVPKKQNLRQQSECT